MAVHGRGRDEWARLQYCWQMRYRWVKCSSPKSCSIPSNRQRHGKAHGMVELNRTVLYVRDTFIMDFFIGAVIMHAPCARYTADFITKSALLFHSQK
jgi:hypothetical protein